MYKGQVGVGIVWLVAVVTGYMLLLIPGLVLHVVRILQAASGARRATPAPSTGATRPAFDNKTWIGIAILFGLVLLYRLTQ